MTVSQLYMIYFKIFIEFIGVTSINIIVKVSNVQLCNASSLYCIVCSPPKVKSPSTTIYPPFTLFNLSPTFLSLWESALLCLRSFLFVCFCIIPSPFSPSPPTPLPCDSCQSVLCIHECVKKPWYIHTMEFYSAVKKKEIPPSVTARRDWRAYAK